MSPAARIIEPRGRRTPIYPAPVAFRRLGLLLVVIAAAATGAADELGAEPRATSAARQLLRDKKGLVPLNSGHTWVVDLELRLRQRLSRLAKLGTSIQSTQRALEEQVVENRHNWLANRGRIRQLRQAAARLSTSDPQRQVAQTQLRRLEARATDPVRLGGRSTVKASLIHLINNRTEMVLAILWVRDGQARLRRQYQRLAADPEVRRALEQLGKKHQLGPEKQYDRQATKYERMVWTDWTPLYRHSGRLRFSVLVNERSPLTFTWVGGDGPTLVTHTQLESAGITVSPNVDVTQHVVDGRRLNVRRVVLDQLRIGRHVLNDVEVLVLPPEGEDLGARIGAAGLALLQVQAQPERLRLRVSARSKTLESKTIDRKTIDKEIGDENDTRESRVGRRVRS